MPYRIIVSISNCADCPVEFIVEPWGESIPMVPDTTFDLVIEAPEEGTLHIEHAPDQIIVYLWQGAIPTVLCNGEGVGHIPKKPFPPVPNGLGVRTFMKRLGWR